ncbi:MAG: FemAB family XrtA/PEP-CTERM system-associated protein [Gemmatimonadota bacterium]
MAGAGQYGARAGGGVSTRVELYRGGAPAWDAFVDAQPGATSSHLYAWKLVVKQVYGHDAPYLVALSDDVIAGVLPLVDVRSFAFGRYLVSMPFLNAGGPLGTPEAIQQLTAAARRLAEQRKAQLTELRCTEALELDLPHSSEKVACVLPLPDTGEQLWSALGGKLRSQVRKPQKEGIELRFGADQIEPFYNVFARNMRDLGSPPHPQQFFESIARELGERVWFGCAYLKDVPVAAGCGLAFRDELEMTWASSLRQYNSLAPNMLLYWSFMERAVLQGFKTFNFGRCTPGSGAHRFKLQWGATDVPLYWYRSARQRGASTPRQDSGSLSLATRLWRHVPLPMANLIGARLRGGIPS